METQIQCWLFSERSPQIVPIFGYASKSLPGLEINGLGKYGKNLKEKLVFLSRSRQLPMPLKRFVISTDHALDDDPTILKWFDLPILLLYWHLAGHIRMARLDNCLSVGHITPSGLLSGKLSRELIQKVQGEKLHLISSMNPQEACAWMDPMEILGHIPQINSARDGDTVVAGVRFPLFRDELRSHLS